MSQRNNKRTLKKAAYDRVDRYWRLINEIKSFRFCDRLTIAWHIVKGARDGK